MKYFNIILLKILLFKLKKKDNYEKLKNFI